MQFILFILDVDYRLCVTWIIHQQIWGYKVEEKLYLGVREQKRVNTSALENVGASTSHNPMGRQGLLQG
jgi:hypothetical protein